tara:strand:- start:2761 stop:3747 length:987 start_codon:yes stop_codon:yes gene_type:complete
MTNVVDYNFIDLNELYTQPLEISWLIEDVIPNNSIGMVYGASGSGKSHIILSMAAMIANGLPWFGKDTKKGSVLVMAGEGLSGISRRFKAIEKEHNLTINKKNLFVSNRAIGVDTNEGYKQVEEALKGLDTPPQLIIIDTLSRHLMESEENSNDDMARFINKLEDIRLQYECTIILVHHTGKSTNQGARGASALKANIDFSFDVVGKDKMCSFACDKMKDADDNLPVQDFTIKGVDLGISSSKGIPITGACVVKANKAFSFKVSRKSNEDIALECFKPILKEWRITYVKRCLDQINDESKATQFRRVRRKLIKTGKIKGNDDGSDSIN